MIKKLLLILLITNMTAALGRETVVIASPYGVGHGGQPAFQRVLDQANKSQARFHFVMENRPGAQGVVALRHAAADPQNRLAIIHAAFVDNVEQQQASEADWRPVHAIGEACWAVITLRGDENQGLKSLGKNQQELVIGTVGLGNATHLTGLAIAARYGFQTRLVIFKNNYDAIINMVGEHGITFGIERLAVVQQFREKNSNLKVLAMSCRERHPDAPNVMTLEEQGIKAPAVFNIVMAPAVMDAVRARELGHILDQATKTVGLIELRRMSDMISPVFANQESAEQFYRSRVALVRELRERFHQQINQAR